MSEPQGDPIPNIASPPPSYRTFSDVDSFHQSEINISEPEDENELTEEELRVIYDREEIDRFLNLFSAFVTEVQAPPDTPLALNKDEKARATYFSNEHSNVLESRASVDGEWTPIPFTFGERFQHLTTPTPTKYDSLSEEIAYKYLAPMLPHPRPSMPPFTIGRLRLGIQRLYLAALPVYGPFVAQLLNLATWEDHGTSLIYCSIFWTLWWYNLLAPALILRILVSLLKRRLFPYPTLEDLRRHREEVLRADEFGQQVSARLSASSSGITEIWRLFRLLGHSRKNKLKGKGKEKLKDKNKADLSIETGPDITSQEQDDTILDDPDDSKETKDLKRIGLQTLDDIADLHERIRNIFIWRRPASSRRYAFILFSIFLISLLPAKYIVKLVSFVAGFVFWHVLPVIASLSPSERKRIHPPFNDVPTDAEYAMELISQRIAAGLQVEPSKPIKHSKKQKSSDSLGTLDSPSKQKSNPSQSGDSSVDWKKWGDRLALGKSAVNDLKRLKPGKQFSVHEALPPRHPMVPDALETTPPQLNVETLTYPCQHTSAPGLITLTQKTLFFTPLMSQNARMVIQLAAVKGVKKAGMLKGLHIRWKDSSDGHSEQKEDKFLWIGGRDELFARLVGSDGMRWMKV